MKPLLVVPVLIAVGYGHGAVPLQEYRLPNGLRVLLAENHERPLVRLELRVPWEPSEIPSGKEGLDGFLFHALGTASAGAESAEAFKAFLDARALRYHRSLHANSLAWTVVADSQEGNAAFEALSRSATRSSLEPSQLELWRQQYIRSIKDRSALKEAEEQFLRAIMHPDQLSMPTATSIHRIQNADVETFQRRVIRPERSVLVIQGDLSLSQAKQLALLHLGAWGPGMVPPVPPPEDKKVDAPPSTRTWILREAGRTPEIQAGGCPPVRQVASGPLRETLARLVRLELGKVSAEALASLDLEIKEQGSWTIRAKVKEGRSVTEALQGLQEAFDRLAGKPITATVFSEARRQWQNERLLRGLHPKMEAERVAEAALQGDPLAEPMDQLQAADLERWLQNLFDRQRRRYFLTGEIREDGKPLEKLGLAPVSVID